MNAEETQALFSQGKVAWNEWAAERLLQRQEMTKASAWRSSVGQFGALKGNNTATEDWIDSSRADFRGFKFLTSVDFSGFTFPNEAWFQDVNFYAAVYFQYAVFHGDAGFGGAEFFADGGFEHAKFERITWFGPSVFHSRALFSNATFAGSTHFVQCDFKGYATFREAIFLHSADFQGTQVFRTFSLERAVFVDVPDFRQTHFVEAPQLDDLVFKKQRSSTRRADIGLPAKYRALRRLAVQGHDHELEHNFFASEIKSRRFQTDFPVHWRIWSGKCLSGVARWWLGWFYQVSSNFGRSILLPLLFWFAMIAIGAGFFLGQSPEVARNRGGGILAYAAASWEAWNSNQPCYRGMTQRGGQPESRITALAEPISAQTSAATEAIHLALRNALIAPDSGGDSISRTYGCLYGFEPNGAVVPSIVSFVATIQKVLSAFFIFLFGLSVRNVLRLK